ncbi:coiled-coil domain-containing protein 112 [Arapaima gigas]
MAAITTVASAEECQQSQDDFVPAVNGIRNWKDKVAQQKKAEFFRNAEKLKKQIDILERERSQNIRNKRNAFRDGFEVLEEMESALKKDRKADTMKVQQQLTRINKSLKQFQEQLVDVKPTPKLLEKLRELMADVDTSISTFKEDQHRGYEELCNEERICWKEICAYEKKIEVWSSTSVSVPILNPSTKVSFVHVLNNNLPPEVMDLEKFLLQTGGRLGGWDHIDHESFLKVWKKHNGKPNYREEALLYLPNKTEDEIRLHEEWYEKVLSLQEKKKEAITRWKAEQQKKKEANQQQQVKEADMKKHESAELKEVEHCRMKEKRQGIEAHLQAWRKQREMQLAQENERRLQEQIQQKKKAKEERRRQLEVKMAVQAHIQQKKEQENLLARERESLEQEEMEKRRRFAAREIKRFQERDLHKLETKLQEKQAKEEEEAEREKRQTYMKKKVEGHIGRDPTRLWRLTKGWEERNKEIGPTGGGPVLKMFHRYASDKLFQSYSLLSITNHYSMSCFRAVPAWRQGL